MRNSRLCCWCLSGVAPEEAKASTCIPYLNLPLPARLATGAEHTSYHMYHCLELTSIVTTFIVQHSEHGKTPDMHQVNTANDLVNEPNRVWL